MSNDFSIPPRKKLKWLAVDLDGTLAWPTWEPGQTREIVGDPIPENIAKLQESIDAGFKIHIHTARPWSHYELIEAWLEEHQIPYDGIICGKVLAAAYIDDKAINARSASWLPTKYNFLGVEDE